ncbi:hypothetical protein ABW21_db0209162 [Orbilia brochopaga]|nr:hypothetical protein ABW21_db0209162 [Drechslerella brochopaga]
MANSIDTKAPTITNIDPKTRLLSYSLQTDHVTAPAQYYPLPLPRSNTLKSTALDVNSNGNNGSSDPIQYPNDRSIIVYGTKTGLTILYPRRSRHRRISDLNSDSDIEVIGDNDCVSYEDQSPPSKLRFSQEDYNLKYESESETEGYSCRRNPRFPWKYSVDLGSPVTEFALPTFDAFLAGTDSISQPWNRSLFITAITEDGAVQLVVLPFRPPPPGVSSTRETSTDFPVDIIWLKPNNRRQPRPRGVCMGILQRMVYVWKAGLLSSGQVGKVVSLTSKLPNLNTSEILIDFSCVGLVEPADDTPNTVAFYVARRLNGSAKILHLDPFQGVFKEGPTLLTPAQNEIQRKFNARQSLSGHLEARKKILAMRAILRKQRTGDWLYQLWAVLDDGEYGFWDLAERSPKFQHYGFCSKTRTPSLIDNSKDEVNRTASISFPIDWPDHLHPAEVCITRYDNMLTIRAPEGGNVELTLGKVFNRASNQLSCSSIVNSEGGRRLLMTQMSNGFTILEYNLSSQLSKAYFQRDEDERQLTDPWEALRASKKEQASHQRRPEWEKELEDLSRKLEQQPFWGD